MKSQSLAILKLLVLVVSQIVCAQASSTNSVEIKPDLPPHIQKNLTTLVLNRQGLSDSAYMTTTRVFDFVSAHKTYKVVDQGLSLCQGKDCSPTPSSTAEGVPPFAIVTGKWQNEVVELASDANILGGFGRFSLTQSSVKVPGILANDQQLKFYGARLLKIGDAIQFDTPADLPLTQVNIGEEYVDKYIMQENIGGGMYLEYHNTPHFHQPLDEHASGYLLLAKKQSDLGYVLTAFQIPYGYAVYTPPNVLHNDAFLVGRYNVIYTVTDRFSTVLLRDQDNRMVRIQIV